MVGEADARVAGGGGGGEDGVVQHGPPPPPAVPVQDVVNPATNYNIGLRETVIYNTQTQKKFLKNPKNH